jgi:putative redox protein
MLGLLKPDLCIVTQNLLRCSKKTHVVENRLIGLRVRAPIANQPQGSNMECTVTWTGHAGGQSAMGFIAETGSGHILAMDGAPDPAKPEHSGRNLAPRPMEAVLAGTGGCTAYDVVLILQRGRHAVEGCSVKLTSERAETEPKVFTRIHMHFTVKGRNLPASAVERAIAMSHDKYCSASIMLAKTAAITTSFEVIDVGAAVST